MRLSTPPCSCQSGYFDNGSATCEICSPNCTLCSAIDNCQECIAGFFFYENYCYETCPDGSFQNGSSLNCSSCDPEVCLTCTVNQTNCILCA